MVRIIYFGLFVIAVSSCESLKQLTFTDNHQVSGSATQSSAKTSKQATKKDIRFLNDIATDPENQSVIHTSAVTNNTAEKPKTINQPLSASNGAVESSSALQMKYAILMNTEVETVQNVDLFKKIDEWWGTKYCLGGTTNKCIDCSAFMQILFASVYGISLPRTAKDQYNFSSRVSRTQLREGDLVFFNTRGGVSHVGFYLQNNKFVHASTVGVTISDLYDPYYLHRFIGVGRIEKAVASSKSTAGGSK